MSFYISGYSLSFADTSKHVVITRNFLNEIMTLLKSKDKTDKQKKQIIIDRYMKNVDFEWSAKMALGRLYLQLSQKEQDEYIDEYRKYIVYTWLQRLNYNSESKVKISVLDKSLKINNTDENVMLVVVFDSETKYELSLYTRITNDNLFKILNLSFEGIDMTSTYRSQFTDYIEQHKNDPKSIIKYLKKQNKEKEKIVSFKVSLRKKKDKK